jgi:hypothetical protein
VALELAHVLEKLVEEREDAESTEAAAATAAV